MIRVASSPGGEKSRRNKNDRCPRASSPVLAKFSRRGRLPFTSYQLPSYSPPSFQTRFSQPVAE